MKNPLSDKHFLKQLDLVKHKEVYAKIILLNFNEEPKYEIQGRITQGSINIDGASALRRTCSLTMVTGQGIIESNYWGLENKFKLEIGIKNTIDPSYPDIIWFKQGLYVITSLNETFSTNAHNISIQGKDKMCLLNGDIGGHFTAISTDFGKIDSYDWTGEYTLSRVTEQSYIADKFYIKDGNEYVLSTSSYDSTQEYYEKVVELHTTHLTIFEILSNMLKNYGKELPHNIIINDIENYGLELLEYRGDTPLYLLKDVQSDIITNLTFNGETKYYLTEECDEDNTVKLKNVEKYDNLIEQVNLNPTHVFFRVDSIVKQYTVVRLEYGNTAGYRKTDLIYPGELVGSLGETIVTILDKIKNMFSGFEYFYDIDGRFIFQKKPSNINIAWNPIQTNEDNEVYIDSKMYSSPIVYSFEDNEIITNINYQPNINNIKNDFSIWGKRKGVSGVDLPIHLRYAIQDKPKYYKKINLEDNKKDMVYYSQSYSGELNSSDKNILCDWREIIYQMSLDYFKYNHTLQDFLTTIANNNPMYSTGITGYEDFYTDMQAFWKELYNVEASDVEEERWTAAVREAPETLNFWIDFLDSNTEFGKYSISRIGSRTKTVNNDKINAVYFRGIPNVMITTNEEYEELVNNPELFLELQGYTFIHFPENFNQYFTISSQGISAWDEFNNLLYQHTNYTEKITLSTFPIYYLQPNNRILINVNENKIDGEYVIDKLTIPLSYNGTGSVQGSKFIKRIY